MTRHALVLIVAAGLRVGAQSTDQHREELLAADRAVADASAKSGFRAALMAVLASDATILYPGAPVVRGAEKIRALLAAQPQLDSLSIRWQANAAVVSSDGEWGFTHGVAVAMLRSQGDSTVRNGNYAMVWRRGPGAAWHVIAAVHVGIVAPQRTVVPDGLGPVEWPALAPSGSARQFIEADLAFTRMAAADDPATAFRSFAAKSAVLYSGQNELRRGPDAIAAPMAGRLPVDWTWHPVVAGATTDGSFGFTVGESTNRPRGDRSTPPALSKYLTVWQREPDGRAKFIYDGGNVRPGAR